MNISELQNELMKRNINITGREISNIWGMDETSFSKKKKIGSEIKHKNIEQLENALKINLTQKNTDTSQVTIPYYPDVVFSAGYGVEIYDDGAKEYITLDERLFRTDRGTKINPKYCELLTISGNSMYPKWEDGDRFILDKSATSFVDGQTFAFKLNGECYIKEICLLGKRAKAIPLNKNYDEFYIEPDDELQIFGRVVPKVRL